MKSIWNEGDRVCLITPFGRRNGRITQVAWDAEIKIKFDDSDQQMWYPPNAVIREQDFNEQTIAN